MTAASIQLSFPGGRTFAATPEETVVALRVGEVRAALRAVQDAVKMGYTAVGYVAYEAAPAFDAALTVRGGAQMPLLWFGLFREPQPAAPPEAAGDFRLSTWHSATPREAYDAGIAAIRAAIARGATYQVNHTLRLRATFEGDDLAFYQRLCAAQQPAYCAYLNLGRYRVLSASPELFFHWRAGKLVTRPMKGTVRRGRWRGEDEEMAAWLAASEKNRAENVMIVDLLRNDLGRVAEVGSVRVPRLFDIERYPTLFQMTSTVTATPRPDLTLEELFAALFPCGSITGAPKVSTMRLIAQLERDPREVYCGAIGYLTADGEAMFNVAIRTVWLDTERGTAEYGVGGGITWDSTAEEEYREALTKAALLTEPRPTFDLLETLRLEDGAYPLLEGHLSRMADSATYFDFPFPDAALRAALDNVARTFPHEPRRVRLLLSPTGAVRAESAPLPPPPPEPPRVVLASTPISPTDRFLYHKTTHRTLYDAYRAARPDAWDVLLWNEEGELTEFTIGNLVVELAGQRYTPPLASGLLPGVQRAALLAADSVSERVLTRDDLREASRVWLINSVRGWVEVSLSPV